MLLKTDVAIVGGGPAGSTVGSLLKKYDPSLKVTIFERETFPRDHVGESQLPAINGILEEMGVWDKVEEAGFPIKLGGTYRWGATDELWYLNFVRPEDFVPTARPAKLDGQRRATAFHVDRSLFDKILLDHTEGMGCEVRYETRIKEVVADGDRVVKLVATNQEGDFEVEAKYYVDASGEGGVLRTALNVGIEIPTTLRNIAFWDYWQDAGWAEAFPGGATRVQIMSLGWGWIWFIPITPTRTSIGLVLPADYYKSTGKRPEDIYLEAIAAEPMIADLTKNAIREKRFEATKDWNYISDRLAGENWFLVGDSCGFADPILSAGMTLAHTSARKVAYSILELLANRHDAEWVQKQYSDGHRGQIRNHIRFADFWYAGNGRFTDLQAYCSEIAESSGLKLKPAEAFAWLGSGGFAVENPGHARAATFPMSGVKKMTEKMVGAKAQSPLAGFNMVQASLGGVEQTSFAIYAGGKIQAAPALKRGSAQLPYGGYFQLLLGSMKRPVEIDELIRHCTVEGRSRGVMKSSKDRVFLMDALEAVVLEEWAVAFHDPSKPPSKAVEASATGESDGRGG